MAEFVQEKVNVSDLLEGMYVARLDRPWVGTPFPLQGFHIRGQNDVRLLKAYCRYVYVDALRSTTPAQEIKRRSAAAAAAPRKPIVLNPRRIVYTDRSREFDRELPVARRLHEDVSQALAQIGANLAAGRPASIAPAAKVARRMIHSVIRNPDAAMWIARMRERDQRTHARCVRSSIWAITLGRHLGLHLGRLEHLALGTLLTEIGFTRLPEGVLDQDPSDADTARLLRSHVQHGLDILNGLHVHEEVAAVVATHHERFDGSGYPAGLRGERIPLGGQIAAIVDVYEELTSPRRPEQAIAPDAAMARLHLLRDRDFGAELIEEFIQAIGIYPPGTLVELSTGEIGLVTRQHAERRLRPRVALVRAADGAALAGRREIDLRGEVRDAAGRPVEIVRSLAAGAVPVLPEPPPQKTGAFTRMIGYVRGLRRG